jgi:hypothetical protein
MSATRCEIIGCEEPSAHELGAVPVEGLPMETRVMAMCARHYEIAMHARRERARRLSTAE